MRHANGILAKILLNYWIPFLTAVLLIVWFCLSGYFISIFPDHKDYEKSFYPLLEGLLGYISLYILLLLIQYLGKGIISKSTNLKNFMRFWNFLIWINVAGYMLDFLYSRKLHDNLGYIMGAFAISLIFYQIYERAIKRQFPTDQGNSHPEITDKGTQ